MDQTIDFEALLDTSLSEDTGLSEAEVLKEAADIARENGIQLTESELQEFRVAVIKRRILRGAEKVAKRLYRLRHRTAARIAKVKYLRTAGAKRLKRLWSKLKKKGGGFLARLKKRFGKRTMVRLVQSLEEPENGALFAESAPAKLTAEQRDRVLAGLLTAEVLAIAGARFVEAKQQAHAEEIANRAEEALRLVEAYETNKDDAKFDAAFPAVAAFNVNVQRVLESDEFWDHYAEHGPLSSILSEDAA